VRVAETCACPLLHTIGSPAARFTLHRKVTARRAQTGHGELGGRPLLLADVSIVLRNAVKGKRGGSLGAAILFLAVCAITSEDSRMKQQHPRSVFAAPLMILALLAEGTTFAQYTISTLASSTQAATFDGKVAVDASGNVYATGSTPVGGFSFPAVLKVTASGSTLVAGSIVQYPTTSICGKPAISIDMSDLGGIAADNSGNVWVIQSGTGGPPSVLRISGGTVSCPAGTVGWGWGIAADNAGHVYVGGTSAGNAGNFVYEGTSSGISSIVAGNGSFGCASGEIGIPYGLAVDTAGNLYIADSRCNVIWKVSPGATPVPVAGNGAPGYSGDKGQATSASLNQPHGVAVDLDGNLYIADTGNNVIREVKNNVINTIAGTGSAGFSGDNGPALTASLQGPWGIAAGPGGVIYIGDQTSDPNAKPRIRQLTPPGAMAISPSPGSTLPGPSVTFTWSGAPAGSQYQLDVSDKIGPIGQGDVFFSGSISSTSLLVSNIPCDGRTIDVQLATELSGTWQQPLRYTYTACRMLSIGVSPSSLPQQGGTVTITVKATNFTSQTIQLNVTEQIAVPRPGCYRNPFTGVTYCPQPAVIGTGSLGPGNSQTFTFNVQIGAMPAGYQYATTRDFAATLVAPSGATLASAGVYQTQY